MCIIRSLRFSRLAQKVAPLLIILQLFLLCSDEVSNRSADAPINFASCKSIKHAQSHRMLLYIPFITPQRYTQVIDRPLTHEANGACSMQNLHYTSLDGGSERLCFQLLEVLNPVARLHHLLFELRLLHVLS